jgi:hypothetical protein
MLAKSQDASHFAPAPAGAFSCADAIARRMGDVNGGALLCVPSGSAALLQTWVMQFVFSNYPFSVIRLMSDSICRLIAGYFQPADDPERIPTV